MSTGRDGKWRTCRRADALGVTGAIARGKGFFGSGEVEGGAGSWERVESQAHYFGRDKSFGDFPRKDFIRKGGCDLWHAEKGPDEERAGCAG